MKAELAKLEEAHDEKTFGHAFLTMSSACIREIDGPLTPKDFNSHSAMLSFVTSKRDLIYELIAVRLPNEKGKFHWLITRNFSRSFRVKIIQAERALSCVTH